MHPDAWLDVGKFAAAAPIKIKGGAYSWVDDGDGYKTIIGLPLISEFEKGVKGAPYEGGKEVLEEIVANAQSAYDSRHYCAKAFKHHNPDTELGQKPELLGYALPTHVGTAKTQRGEKLAVFGNVKVNAEGFEAIKSGRLPGVSPEIRWSEKKITGVAFLDTEEPHNEFPLVTLGEEIKDATGKFKFDPKDEPEESTMTAEEIRKLVGETLAAGLAKFAEDQKAANDEIVKKVEEVTKRLPVDPTAGKPSAMPAQPNDPLPHKMSTDPEMAAKFSALTAKQAELEGKIVAQENEKKAAHFMAKAESALSRKIVPSTLKEQIASFAADWATQKDGEAKLDKYVETLKPALKDKPTVGFEPSAQADVTDPVVAKFAKEGADLSEVAKFGAQWDSFSRGYHEMCMDAMKTKDVKAAKEAFVRNELTIAAAKRDGKLENSRR